MDEHVGLPTIELSGSHREIGRQHGESARTQIRDSIAYYRESFKKITGLEWSEIKRNAPRWVDPIEKYFPGIIDEIRGVGEGAGVAFEEALALNARGELSTHNPFAEEAEEGCYGNVSAYFADLLRQRRQARIDADVKLLSGGVKGAPGGPEPVEEIVALTKTVRRQMRREKWKRA